MHRYWTCAIWNSCPRFLTVKEAITSCHCERTWSSFLDVWKSTTYPATNNKMHCHQITVKDVGLHKISPNSLLINQRTRLGNVNISPHSHLLVSKRAMNRSSGPNSFSLAQQSRFIHLPIPFKKNQNFNALDRIPRGFECIYTTTLNIYIVYFYPFITLAAIGGIIPFVVNVFSDSSLIMQQSTSNQSYILFENSLQILFTIPFVLGLVYISHYFAKRCPLRIYVNEDDEFIAVFATLFPWKTSPSLWNACEVQNLDPVNDDRLTAWNSLRGTHIVGKKRMIILPHAFKIPHYYNVLLGNTLEYMNKEEDEFNK